MKALLKLFKAQDAEVADNRIRAVVSTTGYPDRYGDVIAPGAWKSSVFRDFEQNGWLDTGHEWEKGIGMPISCKVDGDQIVSEAEFYEGVQEAQEIRSIVKQRLDSGKSVSVSIGFMPSYDDCHWFQSGADMLTFAKGAYGDLTGWDTAAIKKLGSCRLIGKILELFEWSIVCVGAHPKAHAIAAKNYDFGGDEPPAVMPLDEHLDSVLAAVRVVKGRVEIVKRLRDADGRSVSPDRISTLQAIQTEVGELLKSLEPEPEPPVRDLAVELRLAEARMTALLWGT